MTDEETIRQTVAELADAWNENDMKTFASLFTEDADYVAATEVCLKGREAIERELSNSRAAISQDISVTITSVQIRFLKTDIALVQNTWEMSEARENHSSRKGLFTQVLTYEGTEWRIAALHNTDIVDL